MKFDTEPDYLYVELTDKDGNRVFEDNYDRLDATLFADNTVYNVTVTAKWYEADGRTNYGEGVYRFIANVLSPAVFYLNTPSIEYGDFVVVSGPGPIGLVATLAARSLGAGRIAVFGTSRDAKRLALAKELGADYTFMGDRCDVVQEIRALTNGQGADVALECVGVSSLLQTDLSLIRKRGKVCCAGIYSTPATFDLDDTVRNSKTIIGAYAGYSFERSVQWITGNNELARKAVKIISHRSSLREIEDALQRAIHQENVKEIFTKFD